MSESSKQAQLDALLIDAHAKGDRHALVALYAQAADHQEQNANIEATCFFLTQEFIVALESGHEKTTELNQRLVAYGREVPLNN